jgi:hypothetical protein
MHLDQIRHSPTESCRFALNSHSRNSRYSRLLVGAFKIPSATLGLRSDIWDFVSSGKREKREGERVAEPGNSLDLCKETQE